MTGKHVILVGLPGAGKSTVGPLVARELGRQFVDVDAFIEERIRLSVPQIFAERGEAEFRRLERESVAELVDRADGHVIAPGGGWAAQPRALDSVTERALTVYLETSVACAAARTDSEGLRPVLDGLGSREERMRELYEERKRCYTRCDRRVGTDDRTPTEVAARVVELARTAGG